MHKDIFPETFEKEAKKYIYITYDFIPFFQQNKKGIGFGGVFISSFSLSFPPVSSTKDEFLTKINIFHQKFA